jgi:hypothetical protein
MPVKYKNSGSDLINNTPIVEKVKDAVTSQTTDDMMSDIVSERLKMKASSAMNMTGVLTPVLYYLGVSDTTNNYATDASGPSDLSYDTKKFTEIKDFRIKLSNSTSLENESDEDEKSYVSTGSFIVLPRTIKPNIGDMFIMLYYGRKMCYQVTSVDVNSYENDSGFECQYVLYKENYTVPEAQIASRKIYRHELVGTTYRPILDSVEYELLKKFEKLYDHLSDVFNNLFYDRTIDSYIYQNYDKEHNNRQIMDNININTLGKRRGLFRANTQADTMAHINIPHVIPLEDKVYDNLLNKFISKNRIFRNYNGLLLSVEPKMGEDRVGYKRSIFGCVESKSIANYKNTFVLPIKIEILSPNINSYFVGKMNAIHTDTPSLSDKPDFFPENLMTQLINGKNTDMNSKCTSFVYNSLDSFMIETIVRWCYDKRSDFVDRFKYLYENIDNLYEHDISYANIYYLFPLIGYILNRTLEEMYSDNIQLDK